LRRKPVLKCQKTDGNLHYHTCQIP